MCCRTRRSMTYNKCSTLDMSGEHAGHDNMLTLLAPVNFGTIMAVNTDK